MSDSTTSNTSANAAPPQRVFARSANHTPGCDQHNRPIRPPLRQRVGEAFFVLRAWFVLRVLRHTGCRLFGQWYVYQFFDPTFTWLGVRELGGWEHTLAPSIRRAVRLAMAGGDHPSPLSARESAEADRIMSYLRAWRGEQEARP